jgi:di/tricarboxylate transporter
MSLMLAILIITITLFIWGKFTPDIIALISMLSLFLFGILNLKETLSGFSKVMTSGGYKFMNYTKVDALHKKIKSFFHIRI